MGSYTELYLGDYAIYATKSVVDPVVMTLFREIDKRVFKRKVADRNAKVWGYIEDDGEIETVYEYTNTVNNVVQRLNVLGFSIDRVKQEFEKNIVEEINRLEGQADNIGYEPLIQQYRGDRMLLENSTFEDWISAFSSIYEKSLQTQILSDKLPPSESQLIRYILGPNDGDEPYYRFPCTDIRSFLRAFLEVIPGDALVVQDITEVVAAGYYDPDDAICEMSLLELTEGYPVNEKIIILTEGSTDRLVLQKSLQLLYPHLFDYYSFMDFGISNAPGGAGSLVTTIKAFVGSGISNRIIAIFDNDTAAYVAIKGLVKTVVPKNIIVTNYPKLDLARSYPTLGPSGISNQDINGLACSIENYFGLDTLTIDGSLTPVQWKGFDVSVGQYQGEILKKQELQDIFFDKLSRCSSDRSQIAKTDWSGIELILTEIFSAFQ